MKHSKHQQYHCFFSFPFLQFLSFGILNLDSDRKEIKKEWKRETNTLWNGLALRTTSYVLGLCALYMCDVCCISVRIYLFRSGKRNIFVMDFSIYSSLCFWSLLFCISRAFFCWFSYNIFAAQFRYSRIYKPKYISVLMLIIITTTTTAEIIIIRCTYTSKYKYTNEWKYKKMGLSW